MTHGSNTSNQHPLHPRDDRETLSALFDGELPGDAARFALKRLDHDAGWRDTCGRWQLMGDALRGEATAAAPADFAAGVMRRLAAEEQATVAAAPMAPVRPAAPAVAATRRRWLGGAALAASVVVAAVLVTRPLPAPSPVQTQAATGVEAPVIAPERVAQDPQTTIASATPTAQSSLSAALASVDAPAAARDSAPRRTVVRPGRTPANNSATAVAAAVATTTPKPFHPPADEITTRPWPRAVLPEAGAESFTVGFGSTSTSSFYPFEPRLPEATQTQPAPAEPQR